MEKLGGRKFVLTIILVIIFTIFVIVGKMDVDQFMISTLTIAGSYLGANAIQKFAGVVEPEQTK